MPRSDGDGFTFKETVVRLVWPPLVPITVIVKRRMGVDVEVVIVNMEVKDGEAVHVSVPTQSPLNVEFVPVGSPFTDRVTG